MRAAVTAFTLIELLVVLLIAALLLTLALPAYQEHQRKGRRTEVAGLLLENAQQLERQRALQGAYTAVAGLHQQSPRKGKALFQIALEFDQHSYRLSARAVAGGLMQDDPCNYYQLDHLGQRLPADARCW
ncbi:MAG: hypothetical protein CVV07_04325 [Gammaproteobacteria bacterium HGW-Gammaproteobacteria-11]|nr:MAG: hypothetical protein CVV07_04325 [Gammaproteobacteria bacterium HGW-Gammaproteobacteria-11]